jgi:hypothetical protein
MSGFNVPAHRAAHLEQIVISAVTIVASKRIRAQSKS